MKPCFASCDGPLDVVGRDQGGVGVADRLAQRLVFGPVEARDRVGVGVAGPDDGVQVAVEQLRAGHQGGDLLLLDHLPVDELLDVGMVEIEDDHLGGAAGGAARLDRPGGAVADLEEAHQAARLAAAGERFAFAAQSREVGARCRSRT